MLLRSASSPIPNSLIAHYNELTLSPEPEFLRQIPKPRSITLTVSCSSSFSSSTSDDSTRKITRALSDTDLRNIAVPKKKTTVNSGLFSGMCVEEEREEDDFEWWRSDSHLLVDEGCGIGSGGGKACWGRGRGGSEDGDDDGRSDSWDSRNRNTNADLYYLNMIQANPGNALLLSNYARFLKEVLGDFAKAEEYCGRAILVNPNDGAVLSMYADLIWQNHKDSSRAESYFDQAVKAAPDDCFVMASYARFLWDANEEEDSELEMKTAPRPSFFNGVSPPPPLAAASSDLPIHIISAV